MNLYKIKKSNGHTAYAVASSFDAAIQLFTDSINAEDVVRKIKRVNVDLRIEGESESVPGSGDITRGRNG